MASASTEGIAITGVADSIIRYSLRADRRPALRSYLERPRRSDKCRSWYIAACIAGGVRRDRPVFPPARTVVGGHCNILASPRGCSSDEVLVGRPREAPAGSPTEAPGGTVAVLAGAELWNRPREPPGCKTPWGLAGILASPLGCTLGEVPVGTPLSAPVGTPGDRRGCRLGGVRRSSFRGGSGCSSLPHAAGVH